MTALSSLPWKAHAILSIMCPAVLVLPPLVVHGLGTTDWPTGLWMSWGFYVAGWCVAAPLVWSEVRSTRTGDTGTALASAVVAHSVLAAIGTLPVTMHYVFALSDLHPLGVDRAQSAAASYALLLVGYLVATAAVHLCFATKEGGDAYRASL